MVLTGRESMAGRVGPGFRNSPRDGGWKDAQRLVPMKLDHLAAGGGDGLSSKRREPCRKMTGRLVSVRLRDARISANERFCVVALRPVDIVRRRRCPVPLHLGKSLRRKVRRF